MIGSPSARDRVLLVEDNAGDARRVQHMLKSARRPLQVEHVTRLSAAKKRLRTGDIGAVILDLGLPDSRGVDTVARLEAVTQGVPVVVVSGSDDPSTRRGSISLGAADFLDKDALDGTGLVRLLEKLLASGAAEDERDASAACERTIRALRRVVTAAKPCQMSWLMDLRQAVGRVAVAWPAYVRIRVQVTEQIELQAPRLQASARRITSGLAEIGARLTEGARRLDELLASADDAQRVDASVVIRVARGWDRWLDDLHVNDSALVGILLDSMWTDIGIVD